MSSVLLALGAIAIANVNEIDEVITVTNTLEQNLSLDQAKLGQSMVVIEREQITSFGQADINSILAQWVPGLFSSAKGGRYDGGYYSLQGSRKQDILWLLDGNRLNNRLYGGVYLDSLNPNMIERIEVLKGGQGIVYGTSAIAGVVNIVTRDLSKQNSAEFSIGADTLASQSIDGYVSGDIESIDWSLYGSYSTSEGYQLWPDENIHWTASDDVKRGYTVYNIGGKARWLGEQDQQLTMLMQFNHADLERLRPYGTINSNNDRDEKLITLDYQHPIFDEWDLQVKGYYHSWDTYYNRVDQDENGDITVVDDNSYWGFEDYGVKAMAQYRSGEINDWLIGAELQQYRGEDEVMNFVSDTETVQSVFVQFRPQIHLTQFSFGLRYSDISDAGDSLNWSASSQHEFNPNIVLSASVGTGFRLPSAEELFSVAEEGGVTGNSDLNPEQSMSANIGLRLSVDEFTFEPLLFLREVDDLIGIKDAHYVNLSEQVNTKGFELLSQWQSDALSISAALTYADTREKGESEQLSGIPKWLSQVNADYFVSDSIKLGVQGLYTGSLTEHDVEVGGEWVFSLSSSYTLGQHTLSLRLENMFDVDGAVSVFNPGSTAPEEHRQPIPTLGTPRDLQFNYRYQM
ncbi:TonB-dependent receptor plug domain-containing protein [Shewanella pneumatophori]|uniref:TonB-dependent receptor n=1 Tax=Shewanella pneumatophori TaxID=314092 RepID=A0A9X1Z8B1_9GAMM|nr:TonB-dependent receptor [Shewanella pneumatophori]MCL1137379.1 TonB-dependent receptor [Shewanella pneumatophori]